MQYRARAHMPPSARTRLIRHTAHDVRCPPRRVPHVHIHAAHRDPRCASTHATTAVFATTRSWKYIALMLLRTHCSTRTQSGTLLLPAARQHSMMGAPASREAHAVGGLAKSTAVRRESQGRRTGENPRRADPRVEHAVDPLLRVRRNSFELDEGEQVVVDAAREAADKEEAPLHQRPVCAPGTPTQRECDPDSARAQRCSGSAGRCAQSKGKQRKLTSMLDTRW